MNSLSFCLSREVFISASFLKSSFVEHGTLGWVLFFSTLNVLAHYLLASKISDEKSADNLIETLYVMCCFSPAALPHFWRMVWPDTVFLVKSFFSFSILNISSNCLVTCKILLKTLHAVSHFFLAVFKILALPFVNFWHLI